MCLLVLLIVVFTPSIGPPPNLSRSLYLINHPDACSSPTRSPLVTLLRTLPQPKAVQRLPILDYTVQSLSGTSLTCAQLGAQSDTAT